jgi:hypothetical protein
VFTILAIACLVAVFVVIERRQDRDTDDMTTNTKHSRQDLRLIAYLLCVVVLLLGVIADRIH